MHGGKGWAFDHYQADRRHGPVRHECNFTGTRSDANAHRAAMPPSGRSRTCKAGYRDEESGAFKQCMAVTLAIHARAIWAAAACVDGAATGLVDAVGHVVAEFDLES